jgi:hypothetical protein
MNRGRWKEVEASHVGQLATQRGVETVEKGAKGRGTIR